MDRPSPLLKLSTLLVALACCCGCQVLGVPSYRLAEPIAAEPLAMEGMMVDGEFVQCEGDMCTAEGCVDEDCLAGSELRHGGIPVPGWFARWHEKKNLPDPPPYPRFHPLPTRPMFAPMWHGGPPP